MISILLSRRHGAWVICNVALTNTIYFFLIVAPTKSLGLATLSFISTNKHLIMVHYFAKFSPSFLFVLTYVTCLYYVVHKQINLIQISFHLGTHYHSVVNGRCKEVVLQIKFLLEEEVSRTPFITNFVITLAASKMILLVHLLIEDEDSLVELLWGEKLNQVMDKFVEFY